MESAGSMSFHGPANFLSFIARPWRFSGTLRAVHCTRQHRVTGPTLGGSSKFLPLHASKAVSCILLKALSGSTWGRTRKQSSYRSSPKRPNNSFKPNLLRYTKAMAEKACHGFGSTTQVGLTQALDLRGQIMAFDPLG